MKQETRVDVLLLAPHTHLGEQKKKGDVINVTQAQCQWLISRGVAKIETTTTKDKRS